MAPDNPFPTPLDDCYRVTLHVIEHAKELKVDKERLILAGDSAGGNAAAMVSQRLAQNKQQQAKFQVLIYPWTQMFSLSLPSSIEYAKKGFISNTGWTFGK